MAADTASDRRKFFVKRTFIGTTRPPLDAPSVANKTEDFLNGYARKFGNLAITPPLDAAMTTSRFFRR
jgi:hypothetical protein